MSISPYRETHWSKIRRYIVRNFQFLISSAVKICKQCLQSCKLLQFLGHLSQTTYRGFAPKPHWELGVSSPRLPGYNPSTQWKFLARQLFWPATLNVIHAKVRSPLLVASLHLACVLIQLRVLRYSGQLRLSICLRPGLCPIPRCWSLQRIQTS